MKNPLINRRDAMKLGIGALAAASTATTLNAAPAEPKKRTIKKAVIIDMVRGGKTLKDKFEILKEAGFDGVEMNYPGGPPTDEVRKACEQTGLLIEGIIDTVHWKQTLGDADPGVRKAGVDALLSALRTCKEIGGTSVLLVPGVVNSKISYDQCYERSQAEIRKALPLAKELGIKIAVEDVWNDFLLSPLEAARYVDEFNDPEAIGWHMDIGNVMAYGYPEQWVHVLGKRIVKLHVKEFSRKKMNEEGKGKGFNVKLGDGDINWKAVMRELDAIPYTTWMCAEVPGGDIDVLKDIAQRMDRILAL